MATITDTTATITPIEQTNDPLIDFEATPEFRQQFQVWKEAKLKEVLAYLHNNWGEEVTPEQLVMTARYVFPDRQNRNLYGLVAPGQTFADSGGNIVAHPVTGQPILFDVWRRVKPPVADISTEKAEETKELATEGIKPEIEPAQPATAV